jgi:hypothetical protein
MNDLRRDDVARAAGPTPAEKLRAALDLADYGIRLKRAALRHQQPEATEAEVDLALRAWLKAGRG